MEGATSNSREFNSRNKQMIGGGEPESLLKGGVGDGCELRKVLQSISIKRYWTQKKCPSATDIVLVVVIRISKIL